MILTPHEQTRGGPLEVLVGVNAALPSAPGAARGEAPGAGEVPLISSPAGLHAFLAGRGALPLAPVCALLCLICLGCELVLARRSSWRQTDDR
jgi:hypothetical protein